MFGFLRKLFVRIAGWLHLAGDEIVSSSPDAIKSTYAAAIKEAADDYIEMQKGLALIMQQAQRVKNLLEGLEKAEAETKIKLDGAIQLAGQDPTNPLHKEAGSKYLVRLDEIRAKKAQQEKDVAGLTTMIDEYKIKLVAMKTQVDDLKREAAEMQVEYMAAQNTLRLEEKLQGIATHSAVDESIIAIREKVANMKAQVRVATEMRGATQGEDVYAEIGAEKLAAERFDELLKESQLAKSPVEALQKVRDLG